MERDGERFGGPGPSIDALNARAYRVPVPDVESDGTLEWDSTTLVVVQAHGGGETGLGYTYNHAAAVKLIETTLADAVQGRDALEVTGAWESMRRAVRNFGHTGLSGSAIAAVDTALWDLKARLLRQPLTVVLDAAHRRVPVYGSGGFTSMRDDQLRAQFETWRDEGIRMFKMKIGRELSRDVARVALARQIIGDSAELFVDANGALTRKQALGFASALADYGVTWFEEPVSSDDVEGLRLLRDHSPPGMEITAGEYGFDLFHFRRLLDAGAVDCLQADATRCAGPSGYLRAAALCEAHNVDLSAHTAPHLHAYLSCAVVRPRHVEYFHDHVRIEQMLFEGALSHVSGFLEPDRSRLGIGLTLANDVAEQYAV